MSPARINENNIFATLNAAIWALFIALAVSGLIFGSLRFATGIVAGGALAIANYYWLLSIMRRMLELPPAKPAGFALAKYILRLAIIALVVYLLIIHAGVDVAGLLIGLSIIVIVITALSIYLFATKGD